MEGLTHSESLLQEYLDVQKVRWEREPILPGKVKRPDYRIASDGLLCWLEVKEFNDPDVKPTSGFSPCPPIADRINKACKQFHEYKDDCCALVLHNCRSIYRSTQVSAVLSAAFGEFIVMEQTVSELAHQDPPRFTFRGRSRLNCSLNTTVSAIVILEHYELQERLVDGWQELLNRHARGDELGPFSLAEVLQERNDYPGMVAYPGTVRLRVLRNPFARRPLPIETFRGPFDQHWGLDPDSGWFSLLWLGNELIKLRRRESPVPFWLL